MTGSTDSFPASSAPKPSPRPSAAQLVANLEAAAAALQESIAAYSDDDVRAPSQLPDWTRGHVLAHVTGVAEGMTRQLEYAARGEKVDLYDGGAEGRNRAIEEGAVRSADRLRSDLGNSLNAALTAFRGLGEDDWDAPISYRNGVVRDGGLAMWRELVIHRTDLGSDAQADSWSPQFCENLFGFLAARVPSGVRLRLQPLGLPPRVLGGSAPEVPTTTVSVNGMATDIAAWLAGRTPNLGSLRAEAAADGVSLPSLLPWPSGIPAK
ncbi:maleylpyruvate isomerase family mycothiol-dependent enzyme [Arthrobacter sp. ATA002]|uniref:maleylpyruvate isomerase family mycothiol-dependent enzyme n=1 Tax=Arthrobacter sp. ATA002 TaxID=2991715 RepID=UPI0022A6E33A|nr:maleylpyruvate isomerase family mycothiol-dependent enzyme [Arthrobacter sp. ATA002]WAP50981.1 maleylpyruvate isomerase family mycothiol-dependent enzyme [Arthrobacter sp. ATA002]